MALIFHLEIRTKVEEVELGKAGSDNQVQCVTRRLMHFDGVLQALEKLPLIPDFFEIVGILFSGVSLSWPSETSCGVAWN